MSRYDEVDMSEADKIGEDWREERKGQYETGGRRTTDDLINEQTAVLKQIRGHTGCIVHYLVASIIAAAVFFILGWGGRL